MTLSRHLPSVAGKDSPGTGRVVLTISRCIGWFLGQHGVNVIWDVLRLPVGVVPGSPGLLPAPRPTPSTWSVDAFSTSALALQTVWWDQSKSSQQEAIWRRRRGRRRRKKEGKKGKGAQERRAQALVDRSPGGFIRTVAHGLVPSQRVRAARLQQHRQPCAQHCSSTKGEVRTPHRGSTTGTTIQQ